MPTNPELNSGYVSDTNWRQKAECLKMDPDIFYPHNEQKQSDDEIAIAKRICAKCIVRLNCLNYALSNAEKYGIWGSNFSE